MSVYNIPSTVNVVTAIDYGTSTLVCKEYRATAHLTGIKIPLSRKIVERRLLKVVKSLCKGVSLPISVPRVVSQEPHAPVLVTEYLKGASLRQRRSGTWPTSRDFRTLGELLARVEVMTLPQRARIFSGVQLCQKRLGATIRAFKAPGVGQRTRSLAPALALGDVTLGNILLCGRKLILLDFEFGHIATVGFDAGLLTAEMRSRQPDEPGIGRYVSAVETGYVVGGGKVANLRYWQKRFRNYYDVKRTSKGAQDSGIN